MEVEVTSTNTTPRAIRKSTTAKVPSSLHDVVVDYLITHAYLDTAQSLVDTPKSEEGDVEMDTAESSNSSNIRLDAETVLGIERRRNIINHILNGAIQKAIDELNEYYPAVLQLEHKDGVDPKGTLFNGHNGASNGKEISNGNGNGNGNGTNPGYGVSYRETSSAHSHQHPHPNTQGVSTWTNDSLSKHDTHRTPIPQLASSTSITPNSMPTFPQSIHPSHILLNLHIQQFIESFRSLPTSMSPGSSTSSLTSNQNFMSMSMSMSMSIPTTTTTNANGNGVGGLQHALTAASGLHAEAALLDPSARAVYVREITDAGALFAYTDPEDSPVAGFLKQERRIMLGEQVNRAILKSLGQSDQSLLERFSRRTSATFMHLKEAGIDPRSNRYGGDDKGREQIGKWWKTQNTTFKLSDFVQQGYI